MSTTARPRQANTLEGESPDIGDKRTARVAGLWYLALAVFGMVGFLVIRPEIYLADDAAGTLSNVVDQQSLARLGVVAEMVIVMAQALAAVWFYKLFRGINHMAAVTVAAFGFMNAVAIMASAIFMATALTVAGGPGFAVAGDAAGTVQLLFGLSESSWGVGALFFGLWLIPMGYVAAGSGRMPVWLGRILMVGGVGYVLSGLVGYGVAAAPAWLVDGLTYLASVGEFWMIGYLLSVGIRPREHVTR